LVDDAFLFLKQKRTALTTIQKYEEATPGLGPKPRANGVGDTFWRQATIGVRGGSNPP
jgi:hypothetical protein